MDIAAGFTEADFSGAGGSGADFTDADFSRLCGQLKASEGLRLAAYRDTVGVLTIGYGHNCEASPVSGVEAVGDSIPQSLADSLFRADCACAVASVRKALPWVTGLSAPRQAVLYDMAFNMGIGVHGVSGLLSFVNTLADARRGNYASAARRMLQSRWAGQVGDRAARLSVQMEQGVW